MKLKKLTHYQQLHAIRRTQPEIAEKWAKIAARNLCGTDSNDFQTNMRWLDTNALETEDGEHGVTDEVNGVMDMVEI